MDRTIKVTGKGKISVKPDQILLNLHLEGVKKSYEEALEQSSMQVEILKDTFEKLGFARTDLKTINFNVNTKYERYHDKHNDWKEEFKGYEFQHSFKIEFEADNKLLGKVLYALAHCSVSPKFYINYTIKDKESAKKQLLKKAVMDSKIKAGILAEAAGVSLGDIQIIDYSWEELNFIASPMSKGGIARSLCSEVLCEESNSYDFSIEPDNIIAEDNVTIIWNILS